MKKELNLQVNILTEFDVNIFDDDFYSVLFSDLLDLKDNPQGTTT